VLESEKRQKKKRVGCVQPTAVQSRCTGLSGGAPDSVRYVRPALVKSPLSGFRRWRTAKNHRTVRWCTGLSGEPTVGRAIHAWRVAGPTVWWGHRTVRCANGSKSSTVGCARIGKQSAPDSVRCANDSKSSTVGCARIGKQSAPDSVRWCTGLSGAPTDRRQELPSWIALNGS
jgi:hypothetical protein